MRLILATVVLALASVSAQAVQYTAQRLPVSSNQFTGASLTDNGLALIFDQVGVSLVSAGGQIRIPGSTSNSDYTDVNNTGTAVGGYNWYGNKPVGTMYSNGQVLNMSSQWHGGIGIAINNAGVVAGQYRVNDATHGFVWSAAGGFRDIGAAFSINDIDEQGRVLGNYNQTARDGFVWSDGIRTGVGPFNNLGTGDERRVYSATHFGAGGEVFGISYGYGAPFDGRAWAENGGMALDTYDLRSIVGIDSAGRIIGDTLVYENGNPYSLDSVLSAAGDGGIDYYQIQAVSSNGSLFVRSDQAYWLLAPVPEVPEPATCTMVLLGIAVTAGVARRRQRS